MSHQQVPQHVTQSQQANSPQLESPPQVVIAQPTVRVMRLYKPCMHIIPTIPREIESGARKNADFAVSPFLLLPDNFGDIYTGELFSAYIAVVNGNQDSLFTQVTLSVRLQTTNATHDLLDCKPEIGEVSGEAKVLNPNEAVDVVVKHTLTELGTHTLRVSVQYSSRYFSETKTLRKFYRFNVLQPLEIKTTATDIGDRILLQCLIINTTKSPLYLEEMDFIPTQIGSKAEIVRAPRASSNESVDHFNLNSLPLLLPEESYATVFSVTKIVGSPVQAVGTPQIKWRSYMGEHGVVVGSEVSLVSANSSSTQSNAPQQQLQDSVYIDCTHSPSTVVRGTDFQVTLRITNNTTKEMSLQMVSRDMVSPSYVATSDQVVSSPSSESTVSLKKENVLDSGNGSAGGLGSSQLFVTGSSKSNIGIVGAGRSVDIFVTVCAVDLGLQELRGIAVLDINTLREYSAKSLLKVMVVNGPAPSE